MAKKASENIKYFKNEHGPVIGTVSRNVIEQDGMYFKDIDGSGELKEYDDWRLPAADRARALTRNLTVEEKIGQLFISDWRMGLSQEDMDKRDESGLLDDAEFHGKTIFGEQHLPGTTVLLKKWWARHMILRANPKPDEMADYLNQLQAVAEECSHFVPVSVASNSRNESGEVVFGMNDASGVFAAWPGTLGIAAAVKGEGNLDIIDEFADCIRREWDATGLRKGYMYMADVVSDPRWQRTFGTFGEDPELICHIFQHLLPRIQGSKEGLASDGVAMTVKHFPGGGARENGFDPHYSMGQWNIYQTEGSLEKYHIPAFQVAVENHASSVMPYYAKPCKEKSTVQTYQGENLEFKPYGFAFNKPLVDGLLRKKMGFQGYINSDTGIIHNMDWGVEMLDEPERIAFAVNHAGVDLISGLFDIEYGMEAYHRGKNGYYDTHQVPEGFTKEQLILTDEALDRAVSNTLREMFELGMFENPYRNPHEAVNAVANEKDWENAAKAHRKSVVLLKNDGTLPVTAEKLIGKKVYAECFFKDPETGKKATVALRQKLSSVILTENPAEADYAILMLTPSSGAYFNATPGYLELDLCEDKTVCNTDETGRPISMTHTETTLSGVKRIKDISEAVHNHSGKVIMNVNISMAWMLGNIEPYADALTAGFYTAEEAILDVMTGKYQPTGKLPLTLPRGDEVLSVNADGVCISPNDVPGYDKDKYMPDSLKDENGKAYAYRDGAGNYYELDFGLSYPSKK
ncbi:MAG: glycoside hydrolase family 3 N-terminal domain-containing protein [Lachnospiraceae bacterium]|nr:glycoside hydrolase family 3 N-terminal domain-containing protein [Lachnospiraceae bacterium]